ncbi:MAG: (Fe-S)-binding protein [Acidilobaceae archaeon]|nr:(Fe-S)-binding protein [Acidilobaceae archaeon]
MPLEPAAAAQLVAENMRRSGFPLPAPSDVAYAWARPLNLPARGSPMLYTGALYQLMPYAVSLLEYTSRLEGTAVSSLALKVSRYFTQLAAIAIRPDERLKAYVERVLRSIVRLLERSGIKVAYPYEDDLYSGALLYDLGLDELFAEQAKKVYKALKARGAQEVITVDPHTTHMLRSIYPKYVDGFDLTVRSYLEVLSVSPSQAGKGEVVIHDPCLYARWENVVEQPRRLLEGAGYQVLEPRRSRRMTYCCGGPIEGIAPKMAKKIARVRLAELSERSKHIVTLCPICYVNLWGAAEGEKVSDIALLLAGEEG